MLSLLSHYAFKSNQKNPQRINESYKKMGVSLNYKAIKFHVSKKK